MSHPINFEEGQHPSLIQRCEHSVMFIRDPSTGKNEVCSICTPAKFTVPAKRLLKELARQVPPLEEDSEIPNPVREDDDDSEEEHDEGFAETEAFEEAAEIAAD